MKGKCEKPASDGQFGHFIEAAPNAPNALESRYSGPKVAPSRAAWFRPLPRPLTIPGVMKLITLGDVRTLIERHLPQRYAALRARLGKPALAGRTMAAARRSATPRADAAFAVP